VPYVGTVVNGLLNCGTVKKGDPVLFGPDSNGGYSPTVVKTMQRKRADVTSAVAGQTVSLALKHVPRAAVRKGMVIVHRTEAPPRGMQLLCHMDMIQEWGFQRFEGSKDKF
jgi:GTPase